VRAKTVFRNPSSFFDQFLVHHADLASRTAEADEARLELVD